MADVKWIKIVTDIFDDDKILLIESMPEADAIIVIWFKLLCLAGKQNNGGVFLLNDHIPYTEEMFATIFRRPLATVRLALNTFEQFGMVEVINNTVTIPSWSKHQSLDKIEARNAYMREYMAERRAAQRALADGKANSKVNSKANVSALDKIREDKSRSDKTREDEESARGTDAGKKPAPSRHRYGTYNRVLLSDDDLAKLKAEFSADWQERIDRLDEYIEIHGDKYKNHLATIRAWARKDKENGNIRKPAAGPAGTTGAANEWAYLDNLI